MEKKKRCPRCKRTKPFSNYHRNPARRDGIQVYCKPCMAFHARAYRQRHPERARARVREYDRTHQAQRAASRRARLSTPYAKGRQRKYMHEYYLKHKEEVLHKQKVHWNADPRKGNARHILHRAVKAGKITRPAFCVRCFKMGPVQGHHAWGYGRPLDVIWLCRMCHGREHAAA